MNLNDSYNICEDWGWFVDIETSETIPNCIKLQSVKKNIKNKLNIHSNKLDKIYEDEYPHMDNTKNQTKVEIIQMEDIKNLQKDEETFIYNIISNTLVTVLLTYFIYFDL